MKIYSLSEHDDSELCHACSVEDAARINRLIDGRCRAAGWLPIAMRIIADDRGKKLVPTDSPWYGSHAPIFRQRAIAALKPLLDAHGELLALQCDVELMMYNALCVRDALDEAATDIARLPDGTIVLARNYVFRGEAIRDVDTSK